MGDILMNIATISGGIMSFYSAFLSIQKYGRENVTLYFNDTKWEHPDLYRFLDDIKNFLDKDIVFDTDGRTPEQVFFDEHFLGCSRVGVCSRVLKAERLQRYYKDGDNLIFGIGIEERHRRQRLIEIYQLTAVKTGKYGHLEFPLIEQRVSQQKIDEWFANTGILMPELYRLGFEHNNCGGGCVKQGRKQWRKLLKTMPEVYAAREDLENRFREQFGKGSYLKDITLKELRETDESLDALSPELFPSECIGICQVMNKKKSTGVFLPPLHGAGPHPERPGIYHSMPPSIYFCNRKKLFFKIILEIRSNRENKTKEKL
jgi:3'-phosphoadenosine 5'-phosphosulfate sulfotransferase (PAPS reductase)/FAD synthetase